jgi:hypothetical protein
MTDPQATCCEGCWKYPEKHDCSCHQSNPAANEELIKKLENIGFETTIGQFTKVLVELLRRMNHG